MTEKADADKLFAFVMTYAQAWLLREPELVPFAATMDEGGECAHLFADPDVRDSRPRREVLTEGIRNATAYGRLRAAALCVQVVLAPKGEPPFDAIMIYLEHVQGLAMQVVVPMQRTAGGEAAYAPARASRGVPNTFFPARPLH
jgi:hypothetical protein